MMPPYVEDLSLSHKFKLRQKKLAALRWSVFADGRTPKGLKSAIKNIIKNLFLT